MGKMKLNKIDYKIQLSYRGFTGSDTAGMTLSELKSLYDSGRTKKDKINYNYKILDEDIEK